MEALKGFLTSSQFVIITHSRQTIAAADVIYGATMQTRGISKVVSMKFADYQANEFLARALKKLAPDKFQKMIVYLEWENVDATNNHVERNNRAFRMLQKTRYKRRKAHTLKMALELDLYARMLSHPLYPIFQQQKIVTLPISPKEVSCLDRAA